MSKISEKMKSRLRCKLAWAVAVTLIPVTAFACFMFYMYVCIRGYIDDLTVDIIITLFLIGACFDQFAHIYCCITANKKGLLMRICAISLEAVSILWCAVNLLMYTVRKSECHVETRLVGFLIVTIVLFIFLWRVMEIVNLLHINNGTIEQKTGVINVFGVMGIFIAAGFLMVAVPIWQVYTEHFDGFGSMTLIEKCIAGFTWSGVTFLPMYIFLLSLHALKTEEKIEKTDN